MSVCLGLFVYLSGRMIRVNITVNGENFVLERKVNVIELLEVTKAQTPEYVTVQINNEIID